MTFALFFLGEYGSMILMCTFTAILFMGGWLVIGTAVKVLFLLFVFIWVRAAFPRYRYDQLMRLGWKIFLPLALGWVLLTAGFVIGFQLYM